MKIESSDTNIESLFTSDFLKIPEFQRPYSWDDDNLEDFWNDVVQNADEAYFIGSMVLFKSGRQEFGVVDGQQRLTTITILLCVIRNFFHNLGSDKLAAGLHSLIERSDRDSVTRFVVMTETSYPFFAEEIQKFGPKDFSTQPRAEETRLQSSYSFFSKKITLVLDAVDSDPSIPEHAKTEKKVTRLLTLRDTVLFLKLIRIELDSEDDAYLIFETLNTRGKDLALSDLLKNHFTKTIRQKSPVNFSKVHWTELLSVLNQSPIDIDPDTFFTHSWSSRFEATTQQKAYKSIKADVNTTNAKKHLLDFVSDARHYLSIFSPETGWEKHQTQVVASLQALRVFRVTQHTPGLLSLVRAIKSGAISYKAMMRALRAIESFHFQFTAVTSSRSSGGISAMYSSFGRRLYEANDSNEAGVLISELIDKLDERKPSISEFMAGFEQINYLNTNTKQSALVRYILRKISAHLGLAFTEDSALLTIEHLHPQSGVNDAWPAQLVGQIGNLILLPSKANGKLADDDFSKKSAAYKEYEASVPQDVLEATEWTTDAITSRTMRLAELAYSDVWRVK